MNKRIRKLRKTLDLTQQEFGERIGMKQNTIALIEGGRNTSDQTIFAICREFNVNEEWLRDGSGDMFKASPTEVLDALAEEYGLSHGDYVLIEKFVNLKAEKRSAVVEYILQAAAAMQSEGADPNAPAIFSKPSVQTPLDPNTATDEEKMAAYKEYLDEKGEKRRKAN